jgi:hypothetical protein
MPDPQAVQQPYNINYIGTQVHPSFLIKRDMWVQISKSYAGGVVYKYSDPPYLHKFSLRESRVSYDERRKRAVYFNNVAPMADMLSGFLFSCAPMRGSTTHEYLMENANKFLTLNKFMRMVAVNSLMYTCGILVDSPKFDPAAAPSIADRQAQGLNPYAVLYMPWQIRNFHYDKSGALEWLVLDNSYFDNPDPAKIPRIKLSFRKWTPTYYQDFTAESNLPLDVAMTNIMMIVPGQDSAGMTLYNLTEYGAGAMGSIVPGMSINLTEGPQVPHPCGRIPFTFVNWTSKNNSQFVDTIFEDIALFDQAIYNYMSLMDEMLSGGVFQYLFWPGAPPKLKEGEGFSTLALLEVDADAKWAPKFDGPHLQDVEPFIKAISFLLNGIKRFLGLDTDSEKSYVQSGIAKKFDFTKVKSLLDAGAEAMEEIEKKIFLFAGLWEGKIEVVPVEYRRDFLGDEQEAELVRMYELLTLPYREMKKQAAHRIAKINFSDVLTEEEMTIIADDIDETEKKPEPRPTMTQQQMALVEKATRQGLTPNDTAALEKDAGGNGKGAPDNANNSAPGQDAENNNNTGE